MRAHDLAELFVFIGRWESFTTGTHFVPRMARIVMTASSMSS